MEAKSMICGKQKATPSVVDVQGGNMETAVAIHRNTHHSFVEAITYQFRSKPSVPQINIDLE
jgi:hypothetical protein